MAGSNPAGGYECLSLVFVVCCVGSGLCDGLITFSEVTYVCVCARACVLLYVIWKPQRWGCVSPIWAVGHKKKEGRKDRDRKKERGRVKYCIWNV